MLLQELIEKNWIHFFSVQQNQTSLVSEELHLERCLTLDEPSRILIEDRACKDTKSIFKWTGKLTLQVSRSGGVKSDCLTT